MPKVLASFSRSPFLFRMFSVLESCLYHQSALCPSPQATGLGRGPGEPLTPRRLDSNIRSFPFPPEATPHRTCCLAASLLLRDQRKTFFFKGQTNSRQGYYPLSFLVDPRCPVEAVYWALSSLWYQRVFLYKVSRLSM